MFVELFRKHWSLAPLPDAERALFAFAETLTRTPSRVRREDVDALVAAGWSDGQISDAVQVIGYFNYINRIAEGLGVDLEPGMPPAGPRLEP